MHAWPPLRSRGRKQPACQGSSPVGAERLAFRATEAVGHFCNRGEKWTIGGLGALENRERHFSGAARQIQRLICISQRRPASAYRGVLLERAIQ